MSNLKGLRRSLATVKKMIKITSAMKLISATKFKRMEGSCLHSFKFCEDFFELKKFFPVQFLGYKKIYLIFSSDRGLCGSYNNNVRKMVPENDDCYFGFIGKKASKKLKNILFVIPSNQKPQLDFDDIAEIHFIYTHFLSVSNHEVRKISIENFTPDPNLPFVLKEMGKTSIRKTWISDLVDATMSYCARNAELCEHSVRMVAMEKATHNAQNIAEGLKITYNKTRQSLITQEITEITSGANE